VDACEHASMVGGDPIMTCFICYVYLFCFVRAALGEVSG
jgi:hypothetical protein